MLKILREYSLLDLKDRGDNIYTAKIKRIVLQVHRKNLDDFLQDLSGRVTLSIPTSPVDGDGALGLRKGATSGYDITGILVLKFFTPIDLDIKGHPRGDRPDLTDLSVGDIIGINGERTVDIIESLVHLADDIKKIDFQPDVVKIDNEVFNRFLNEYIRGGLKSTGERLWNEVMDIFHQKVAYSPPSAVFRGMSLSNREYQALIDRLGVTELEKGDRFVYEHLYRHPISASRSRKVGIRYAEDYDEDYAIVIKLSIIRNDVVVDMKELDSSYPVEAEVVLRPDVTYNAEVTYIN